MALNTKPETETITYKLTFPHQTDNLFAIYMKIYLRDDPSKPTPLYDTCRSCLPAELKLHSDWLVLLSFHRISQSRQAIGSYHATHISLCNLIGSPHLVLSRRNRKPAIPCGLPVVVDATVHAESLLNSGEHRTDVMFISADLYRKHLLIWFGSHTHTELCDAALPPGWTAAGGWHCAGRSRCICPRWSIKILISR